MTRSPYNREPRRGDFQSRSGRERRYRPGNSYEGQDLGQQRRLRSSTPPGGSGGSGIRLNTSSIAVIAGVLVVGIGIGSAITSTTQGGQGNIASQQQLDMAVPDPEFCRQWGASAFVIDVEMYTTLNPSTSFVTQPALQPGCVIRRENWTVLQKQGAITNEDVRECKQRMNTFAYIGSIRDNPVVRCVYQADINENKFIMKGVAEDGIGVNQEAVQF